MNLESILSDLQILRDKSSEDIKSNYVNSYEYYYLEFNRILAILRKERPDLSEDIRDIPLVSMAGPVAKATLTPDTYNLIMARIREMNAVAYKLCSRLVSEKNRVHVETNTLDTLERIFSRFHQVARQMRHRYHSRPTIDVSDEYDVQDLLHALLRLYFDDIRPEEWTPSYAGSSSKMDFLLKEEQVVIEVKKTREHLLDKEIGEQLIVDAAKYKTHPDCRTLVCFIYDPEGKVGNPTGLENDLGKQSDERLDVKAFVYPK